MLTTADHSRDSAGLRYVYPVVSRRAGGISLGINLNPNNACNWRCVYCQVPGLTRGGPPPIDLALLENELDDFLRRAGSAEFLAALAPEGARRIVDVAFSGNGEPTSSTEFGPALESVAAVLARQGLADSVKVRLITNGSLVDRLRVREALGALGQRGGEVWFKLDAVGPVATRRINGSVQNAATVARRLGICSRLATTWVQSCFFLWDGTEPAHAEVQAYLDFLAHAHEQNPMLAGVLLYGLARPSCQAESTRLGRLPAAWLEALAARIRQQGLAVQVSP